MKKILITSLSILSVFAAVSCNMDKQPFSTISQDNAVQSLADAAKLRQYIYSHFRGMTSGEYIYSGEVQTDLFHASSGFGNNGGDLYRWDFTTGLGNALNLWGNSYIMIANDNFLIESINDFIASQEDLSESDLATLQLYKGDAFFSRAFSYFQLATYFCADYDAATAANEYGVPIVTVYSPTSDESKYPGRESLARTFEQINADLDSAEAYIQTEGSVGAKYFTKDVVSAFRARVALYMDDYPTAIRYAEPLIANYPLADSDSTYADLWLNDSGVECIMQVFSSMTELPGSSSYNYVSYSEASGLYTPYYIPTQSVIDLYAEDDMRFTEIFELCKVTSEASSAEVYLCNKYPGNPDFYQGVQTNYCNSPKPFRIAEQYLILAEAYAQTGNLNNANNMLNELRGARIPSWTDESYGSNNIMQEIRDERVRELFAEGFRMLDLRRYGEGFSRGPAQNSSLVYMPDGPYTEMTVSRDNFHWIWPIPTNEINSNPQISGQQNPGYTNQ